MRVGGGRAGAVVIRVLPPEQPARPGTAFPPLFIIWRAARSRQERQRVPGRCLAWFCTVLAEGGCRALPCLPSSPVQGGAGERQRGARGQPAPAPLPGDPAGLSLAVVSHPAALWPAVACCGQRLPGKGRSPSNPSCRTLRGIA